VELAVCFSKLSHFIGQSPLLPQNVEERLWQVSGNLGIVGDLQRDERQTMSVNNEGEELANASQEQVAVPGGQNLEQNLGENSEDKASGEEELSAGDIAKDALAEEIGIDEMLLTLFYFQVYENVIEKPESDADTTVEEVEAFKKYLLGGGDNWKKIVLGSVRKLYGLKDAGYTIQMEDGTFDEKYLEQTNLIVKAWIERNGGDTKYGGCYVATAVYGSYNCPEVWALRRFRDQVLQPYAIGRMFVRAYYAASPRLVCKYGETRWFTRLARPVLNKFVGIIRGSGISDSAYQDYWD
jgi:hypothetical protein